MKRVFRAVIMCIVVVSSLLTIGAPSALASYRYVGDVEFYFSTDGGARYSRERRVFYVGDTVLMQIRFSVTRDRRSSAQVGATLSIPNTDSIEVMYMEGQIVEPVLDHARNVLRYEYIVTAEREPAEQRIIFQIRANEAATILMTFEFDDNININPISNRQHTIEFVEREVIMPVEYEYEDEYVIDEDLYDDNDVAITTDANGQANDNNLLYLILVGVGVSIIMSIVTLIIVLVKVLPRNYKHLAKDAYGGERSDEET